MGVCVDWEVLWGCRCVVVWQNRKLLRNGYGEFFAKQMVVGLFPGGWLRNTRWMCGVGCFVMNTTFLPWGCTVCMCMCVARCPCDVEVVVVDVTYWHCVFNN